MCFGLLVKRSYIPPPQKMKLDPIPPRAEAVQHSMTSRLGAWRSLCWSSGGGAHCSWFSGRLALAEMHLQGTREAELIESDSSLHELVLFCSLSLVSADGQGRKWPSSVISYLEQGVCTHHSSGSPHRRANNYPCSVPSSARSLPSPCLFLGCLPSR